MPLQNDDKDAATNSRLDMIVKLLCPLRRSLNDAR